LLDNGTIDTKEAINSIDKKSILKRAEIASVFNKRTEIMFPLKDNTKMLPALRKEGFKLYYLSNFHIDIFTELKNSYSFLNTLTAELFRLKSNIPNPILHSI